RPHPPQRPFGGWMRRRVQDEEPACDQRRRNGHAGYRVELLQVGVVFELDLGAHRRHEPRRLRIRGADHRQPLSRFVGVPIVEEGSRLREERCRGPFRIRHDGRRGRRRDLFGWIGGGRRCRCFLRRRRRCRSWIPGWWGRRRLRGGGGGWWGGWG